MSLWIATGCSAALLHEELIRIQTSSWETWPPSLLLNPIYEIKTLLSRFHVLLTFPLTEGVVCAVAMQSLEVGHKYYIRIILKQWSIPISWTLENSIHIGNLFESNNTYNVFQNLSILCTIWMCNMKMSYKLMTNQLLLVHQVMRTLIAYKSVWTNKRAHTYSKIRISKDISVSTLKTASLQTAQPSKLILVCA